MTNRTTEEMRQIKQAFEALSRSPNGKVVLEYLRTRWIEVSLVGVDPHSTTIKAAQADLAQTLINLATKPLPENHNG